MNQLTNGERDSMPVFVDKEVISNSVVLRQLFVCSVTALNMFSQ